VTDIQHDTLQLARALIACRSVTPADGGALTMVATRLSAAGFRCERLDRGSVSNLWARYGDSGPLVCLAGHVDVVPPGPVDEWSSDPFTPTERDGELYGRGAADMKGSVAAMVTAAERIARTNDGVSGNVVSGFPGLSGVEGSRTGKRGSIAVLLTSDEEGDAVDGTAAVVSILRERGETIDACIVGEPSSTERFGDTIKNGRRGSLNGRLRVRGEQCHIAYPERGRNPIHDVAPALAALVSAEWDRGNEYFQPTSFQISNIHAGTGASNIIPGALDVAFNFRYSPESTAQQLQARVREILDRHSIEFDLEWTLIGEPFLTRRGPLVDALVASVESVTGVRPVLSTSGGTSDGRFLATLAAEVVEFGPLNLSIHKIDEHVRVTDLGPLSVIYERTVMRFFELP
jgi:succinyl-diaminopimelate desuccinylase